jgi:hypothetical protein
LPTCLCNGGAGLRRLGVRLHCPAGVPAPAASAGLSPLPAACRCPCDSL